MCSASAGPADRALNRGPRVHGLRQIVFGGVTVLLAVTPPAGLAAEMRVTWATPMDGTQIGTWSAPHTTYRTLLRGTTDGSGVRVRFSNRYGSYPLAIDAAAVGRRAGTDGAAVVVGSQRRLTFGGAERVVIPPYGAQVSDVVGLDVRSQGDLVVSLYVPTSAQVSLHDDNFEFNSKGTTQYQTDAGAGDHTLDESGEAFRARDTDVFWTDAVEVLSESMGSIVALGDSLTDGADSLAAAGRDRADAYDTYPDVLSRRLHAHNPTRAVVNSGISGDTTGAAEERLERDVLGLAGVSHVIVLLGSNDIPGESDATATQETLARIATRIRSAGITPIGGTIPPRIGFTPAMQEIRHQVNRWIKKSSLFAGTVDFDAILRDPADPERLNPAYDSGDATHPNPAGLAAMANGVDLTLFALGCECPPIANIPSNPQRTRDSPPRLRATLFDVPRAVTRTQLRRTGLRIGMRVSRAARATIELYERRGRKWRAAPLARRDLHLATGTTRLRLRAAPRRSQRMVQLRVTLSAPATSTRRYRRLVHIK